MAEAIKRQGKTADGRGWAFVTFGPDTEANRIQEILSGSDRVAVIVGNAYLEELLEKLLRAFLVEDKNILDNVFNPLQHGTLSTATAKIDIAYLLGLISKDTRDCLKGTARIRNIFAHHSNIESFSSLIQAKIEKKDLSKFKRDSRKFLAIDDATRFNDEIQEIGRLYRALVPILETEIIAATSKARKKRLTEQNDKYSHFVVHF